MGRGFLSGLFWGGILSLVALFVSNQTLDRQSLSFPKPNAAEVEVPGGSEFNQARPETDPVVPGTDARPENDPVAEVAVPDEGGTEPPALETSALEVPVPATTQDAPEALGDAPAAVEEIEGPATAPDASVETDASDALVTPDAPGAAPETAQVDVPVQDATPAQEEEERAPLIVIHDAPASDGETEIAALPETVTDPEQPAVDVAPQVTGQTEAPSEPSAPDAPDTADLPWLDRLRASQIDEAPDAPDLPVVSEEPSLPPVTPSAPDAPVEENAVVAAVEEALAPEVENDTGAPIVIEVPSQPEVADGATEEDGSLLQPVETLTEREDSGTGGSGALPVVRRLGDSSAENDVLDTAQASEDASAETDAEIAEEVDETAPALTRYATAFEAPQGVPLLSIVLVHQGDTALSAGILEILPPNIGFAVDASLSGASDIARAYRSAGREVVMIPALPAGAAPQDIEQALGANFDLVPEAVAVMDVSGSSFQSDRDAVEQVVDVVSASGHGVITFPRGLNTAHQAAQRAGVPTGLIFRNLDGASEDQETIRRSLDRAAFRARQDEAVILVGSTGSTMLSALSDWVLGNRAATVAIAPISVALGG